MPVLTLEQLEREFGSLGGRATDLSPVMKIGGIMGLGEVKERFQTSTGPDGKPWPPLKYPRPEGGSLPLLNHGTLRASYSSESDSVSWRVGTNLEKARLLHYGGEVKPVKAGALTIPLTRQAIYAGSARAMPGLFRIGRTLARQEGKTKGTKKLVFHWVLSKSVTIPARPQVGVSAALLRRFSLVLVNYIRTGRLSE